MSAGVTVTGLSKADQDGSGTERVLAEVATGTGELLVTAIGGAGISVGAGVFALS